MEQGSYLDRREGEVTELRKVITDYIDQVTAHKKGWRAETNRLKQIAKKAPFSRKAIAKVTPGDISGWRNRRLEEAARNTVRNDMLTLSAVYQHAMKEWRIVDSNPVRAVKWPSPGKPRARRLRPGEEAKLLEHADPATGSVLRVLLETGMRIGELLSVTYPGMLDLEERVIRLPDTKNDTMREVPLSAETADMLWAHAASIETERLWPWAYHQWRYRFDKIRTAAGITDLRTHDLRHEGVSRLQEAGLDVFEIAAISGHKTLANLGRYTHPRVQTLRDKLDKLRGGGASDL